MSGETSGSSSLPWVSALADTLIREIFQETAGILLFRKAECPPPAGGSPIVSIYSKADGAYGTELVFQGELSLFFQIASNMQGIPAPRFQDAVDYGLELFNMFCGRFISEVYRATGVPARFYPPQYLGTEPCPMEGSVTSICYCSQNGCYAQFSWTSDFVEQLHTRRTAKHEA